MHSVEQSARSSMIENVLGSIEFLRIEGVKRTTLSHRSRCRRSLRLELLEALECLQLRIACIRNSRKSRARCSASCDVDEMAARAMEGGSEGGVDVSAGTTRADVV